MLRRAILAFALLMIASLGWAYWVATSAPVVRRATIAMAGWPAGAPPVRLLLLSDIHVAGPDMPPERLARIVGQVTAGLGTSGLPLRLGAVPDIWLLSLTGR